jgi:hypothetical protein
VLTAEASPPESDPKIAASAVIAVGLMVNAATSNSSADFRRWKKQTSHQDQPVDDEVTRPWL